MQIAKRPSGDSRWQRPPALAGLWGNTEEPDKPSESFQGDAAAEDEPAGAVSTDQLQHKAVLMGGCFKKKNGFIGLEKKDGDTEHHACGERCGNVAAVNKGKEQGVT